MRFVNINLNDLRSDPRFARFSGGVGGTPVWVWRMSIAAAMFVGVLLIVPLIVGGLLVVAVFATVFFVLSMVAKVVEGVQGMFGPRAMRDADGRENVRVIRSGDSGHG